MASSVQTDDRIPEPPHARRPWVIMWLAFGIITLVLTVWGFIRAAQP